MPDMTQPSMQGVMCPMSRKQQQPAASLNATFNKGTAGMRLSRVVLISQSWLQRSKLTQPAVLQAKICNDVAVQQLHQGHADRSAEPVETYWHPVGLPILPAEQVAADLPAEVAVAHLQCSCQGTTPAVDHLQSSCIRMGSSL